MLTRRHLLRATSGLVGAVGLGLAGGLRTARAALPLPQGTGRMLKFIFVMNYGGWDPTRVFAPEFANPNVSMEPEAVASAVGALGYVEHPARPSVRAFFEAYAARSVVFNGVLVASVAHETCLRISLTGASAQDRPDWGAILASARSADFPLPHVVIGGPSFPGPYGASVTHTGTNPQLSALLTGDIATWSDIPVGRPCADAETIMDAALERRAAAAAILARPGREAVLTESLRTALERAGHLKGLAGTVAWDTATFQGQMQLAVDLLALGVSRVATLSFEGAFAGSPWDTHLGNDLHQSDNFERLFVHLLDLVARLEATPGESGGTLADETVLVILSEMGRAPLENLAGGKDHWPCTSLLLVGPGVAGGRVIGAFDGNFYGHPIDLASGEVVPDGEGACLDAAAVGATLLRLAELDPAEHLAGVPVVEAALG
ncbi:MAG: DUF1501 domain-containing protein [Pseudomonadota bacterium]|nr:DUF1501 domain-containing protein [Pseudomonadota bacterium]